MTLTLQQRFGNLDIYLFDQLLRGNIAPGMTVLDAGCGHGRNLVYLLREGYTVCGVDANPEAIAEARHLAATLAPNLPRENFRVEPIEGMTFSDATFDVVLLNAVLHFAASDEHFDAMLRGAWRVLKPGGPALLPTRLHHRHGEHPSADRRSPLSLPGWRRALPRRRGDAAHLH